MSRLLFWAAAAVVSAGVAFAVTVPVDLERPEQPEEASSEAIEEPEQASPEARDAPEAQQAETVEASLTREERRAQRRAERRAQRRAERRAAREAAEAESGETPDAAAAEERSETEAAGGADQQAAAEPPSGPFAQPVLQAPTGFLPTPQSPAGVSPGERASSSLAAGPLAAPPQPQQPRRATIDALALDTLSFSAECGLILRPRGDQGVIFAAGVSLDPMGAPAAISLDGQVVTLRRVGVDGEPLGYSQFSRQLFQDEAERLQVLLEIALEEEPGTGDSARVSRGEVTVAVGERPIAQLEVGGRAGC